MYLCFVDESGTHGGSPVLVVGGIIVHEEDAWHLQRRLDSFLFNKLHPLGHDHTGFELHATELRRGTKQWVGVGQDDRHRILAGADGALAGYAPVNPACRGVSSGPSWNATRAARSLEHMSSSSRTYIGPGLVVTPPVDTCAMRTQRPRDGQTSLAARLSLPSGRAQERRSGGSG